MHGVKSKHVWNEEQNRGCNIRHCCYRVTVLEVNNDSHFRVLECVWCVILVNIFALRYYEVPRIVFNEVDPFGLLRP